MIENVLKPGSRVALTPGASLKWAQIRGTGTVTRIWDDGMVTVRIGVMGNGGIETIGLEIPATDLRLI